MTFFCNDCKSFFEESEIEKECVQEQTRDNPEIIEWHCPCCGSEEIEEAKFCDFCGEPIDPNTIGEFCEDCSKYLKSEFDLFVRRVAARSGQKPSRTRGSILEFIAETM